jgi:hypothetical protein
MSIYKGTEFIAGTPDLSEYAKDQNVIHKSGNEEISGDITFSKNAYFKNGNNTTRIVQQDDGNFVIYKNNIAILACHNGEILVAPNNANTTITNSVVTTTGIYKSANGYVKLGNGVIIQWGAYTQSNTSVSTITLPTAFTSTNYQVTLVVDNIGWQAGVTPQTHSYTTTTFKALINVSTGHWIAIGY